MKIFNQQKLFQSSGFTMIEMFVTFGILAMIFTVGTLSFNTIRDNVALKNEALEIVNALRQAQNDSLVSQAGQVHGIYLTDSGYRVYNGEWPSGDYQEYPFPEGINVYAGENSSIEFSRLTGAVTNTATIVIGTSESNQKNIIVEASGKILLQ